MEQQYHQYFDCLQTLERVYDGEFKLTLALSKMWFNDSYISSMNMNKCYVVIFFSL